MKLQKHVSTQLRHRDFFSWNATGGGVLMQKGQQQQHRPLTASAKLVMNWSWSSSGQWSSNSWARIHHVKIYRQPHVSFAACQWAHFHVFPWALFSGLFYEPATRTTPDSLFFCLLLLFGFSSNEACCWLWNSAAGPIFWLCPVWPSL